MKSFLLGFALLCCPTFTFAQQWAPEYATAQVIAAREGKHVVVVFSGSDWCAPCIKLDREIWQDANFQQAADADFVFYRADFPRRKENRLDDRLAAANVELAEAYNPRGAFPLVVVLTPEGGVVGQTGYQKLSPEAYLAVLKDFLQ